MVPASLGFCELLSLTHGHATLRRTIAQLSCDEKLPSPAAATGGAVRRPAFMLLHHGFPSWSRTNKVQTTDDTDTNVTPSHERSPAGQGNAGFNIRVHSCPSVVEPPLQWSRLSGSFGCGELVFLFNVEQQTPPGAGTWVNSIHRQNSQEYATNRGFTAARPKILASWHRPC